MNLSIKDIKRASEEPSGITDAFASLIIAKELPDKLRRDITYKENLSKYLQETGSLPIDMKEVSDTAKANNKLKFDFRGSIVDNQTNYFIGKPIRYNLDNPKGEGDREKYEEETVDFFLKYILKHPFPKLDKETSRTASIQGASGRLFYYGEDEQIRFVNLYRNEYHLIYDTSIDEVILGFRYYPIVNEIGEELIRVEFYDKKFVRFFIEVVPSSLDFMADPTEEPKPHFFDYVPIIEFPNDDFNRNDFYKVENLIDAYNKTCSLNLDELEDLRNSYLAIIGAMLDKETIELMKQTGVINFPEGGGDAKYVVRNLSPEVIEKILTNLEDKIFKLSATIDFNSKDFTTGGAESGESRKYKLIGMEGKAMDKENSYRCSLKEQFKILCSGWRNLKIIEIDPDDIYYEFSRNLPTDLLYWTQVMEKLGDMVSRKTKFDLMPFIPNTEEELKRMEDERGEFQTRLYQDDEEDEEEVEETDE